MPLLNDDEEELARSDDSAKSSPKKEDPANHVDLKNMVLFHGKVS